MVSRLPTYYLTADRQRRAMYTYVDDVLVKTTYYAGLYEQTTTDGGSTTTHYNYINTVDGLSAVVIDDGLNEDLYYINKDNLGSITALFDESGSYVAEYSYDPWGRQRKPTDWLAYTTPDFDYITRGYTGHEHLPFPNLINMNGRVYDPITARFLSPDPFVQNPAYSQDFNRYSYVNNNPLRFTDPSGYMSIGCGHNPTWKGVAWGVANQHADLNAHLDYTYWRGDYVMGGFGGTTANYYLGRSLLASSAVSGGIGGADYTTEAGYAFLYQNYGVYRDQSVKGRGLGRYEQVSGTMIIGLNSEGNAIPNTLAISTVLCVWVPADLPEPEWNDVGWERPFENYGKPEPILAFVGFNHGVPEFETSLMPNAYGVTPGPFVIYSKGHSSDNSLNTHEPGHVIQFFVLGPTLYYSHIAIPSLITVNKPYHNDMPWEKSANTLWYWLTGEKDESNPRYFE